MSSDHSVNSTESVTLIETKIPSPTIISDDDKPKTPDCVLPTNIVPQPTNNQDELDMFADEYPKTPGSPSPIDGVAHHALETIAFGRSSETIPVPISTPNEQFDLNEIER